VTTDVAATWQGDACGLVEAFRAGERSPREEVEASIAAVGASDLNAIAHLDAEAALAAADAADIDLPFGGVPVGIKQLEPVAGWPYTKGSLVFAGRVATGTSVHVSRLVGGGGAIPLAQTTASEFGGLNISVNRLNGVTHNPWRRGRTAGGSSGGSAAAVAGGLVPMATGGDGGGSIRIPAGYTGLLGFKGTFGRIPRGPGEASRPHTVVLGCLARSVRDAARHLDVCAGHHPADPTSLPSAGGWEAGLGGADLSGLRVVVDPSLGGVALAPGVADRVEAAAEELIAATGMRRVDVPITLPRMGAQWVMGNVASLLAEDLAEVWPGCADDLTDEVRLGVVLSQSLYNLRVAAEAERERMTATEAMAGLFAEADLVLCATNPDTAFDAEAAAQADSPLLAWARSSGLGRRAVATALTGARVGAGALPGLPAALLDWSRDRFAELLEMGALTMVSNLYGNPAVSIPAGLVDGLPVGLQVLAPHHADALLLDVALAAERTSPWPLTAPSARAQGTAAAARWLDPP
jgi:aspartyl-tRNA(Asn)/glutamyl-tRNA(Gln) amidotransferase subunit A